MSKNLLETLSVFVFKHNRLIYPHKHTFRTQSVIDLLMNLTQIGLDLKSSLVFLLKYQKTAISVFYQNTEKGLDHSVSPEKIRIC